ncbi:SDR family NAD(P)-dependent oxidoreductase [Streptomyces clavuligerus]|uniref:Putative oxidoreductase n=1 Tax=Streptomyces clavuligerus TaxID=1901 RepID=B5GYT0_STRCL|nr:SDR family oxidoreductase [Streptomyces clavuligerus]ANW22589.1 short-chain dehydrogenase [Streptomyces clavuligerus]AXU16941.1 SDR family oxidoreductase [Streptomyces clavuligerus]EDY51476.1 short-chain dehydrogenase/reductase SDR [Streptomyces clavuligerus]EFG04722.1 Putative oxidoreductase [Streptomyces clavuligerus]MBY6306832.1 SDR family oxidoreductase [Streptomyces clavuligerus]
MTEPGPVSRVALITGASTGLGETLASHLHGLGWSLVLTARTAADLTAVADRLSGRGGTVIAVAGDVGDAAHRERLIAAADSLGRLDWLVNNASRIGVSPIRPLLDHPAEVFDEVLRTNVAAPLALAQPALPALRKSGGLVVNLSSVAAVEVFPCAGIYAASKAALDQATRVLAVEIADSGAGAVSVDPGDMRTRGYEQAEPGFDLSGVPGPEVTLPFWEWLTERSADEVNGRRYQAQSGPWEPGPR